MHNPTCPICQAGPTVPVLERFDIYLTNDDEGKRLVGAPLAAFHCERSGHVFFVRTLDLEPRTQHQPD